MSDTQIDRTTLQAKLKTLEQVLAVAEADQERLSERLRELKGQLQGEDRPGRSPSRIGSRVAPPTGDPRARARMEEIRRVSRDLAKVESRIAGLRTEFELNTEQLELLDGKPVTNPQVLVAATDRRYPFILLPVSIQTRFAYANDDELVLKVRVFPDDIHAQTHVPTLEPTEEELRQRFKEKIEPADGSAKDESAVLQMLLTNSPVARSAWVARTALDSRPPVRDPAPGAVGWADLLPRRWVVLIRSGETVLNAVVSGPVTGDATQLVLEPDDETTEITAQWLRDFDIAKAVGMAVDVPVGSRDAIDGMPDGLDVVVVGVDHVSGTTAVADLIGQALSGHMFSAGLRLLPQGTPTNNTTDARARVESDDESVLRDLIWPPAYPAGAPCDAALLERALGLRSGDLAGIARPEYPAFLYGDRNAAAMATALWAATQGYTGKEITGVPPPYGHFTRYVRGRGPLPVLAVGAMPYGIAVCGASDRVPDDDVGQRVVKQSPFFDKGPWERALAATPTVPTGLAQPEAFLEMIKLTPSSRRFRMRLVKETGRFVSLAGPQDLLSASARPYLASHSWLPTLGVADRAFAWRRGLVTSPGLQPTSHGAYISAIADSLSELITRAESDEGTPTAVFPKPEVTSDTLLYHLLRYGAAMTAKWAGLLATPMPKKSPFLTRVTEAYGVQPGQLAHHGNISDVYSSLKASAGLTLDLDTETSVRYSDEGGPAPGGAPTSARRAIEPRDAHLLPGVVAPDLGDAIDESRQPHVPAGPAQPVSPGSVEGKATPVPEPPPQDSDTTPRVPDLPIVLDALLDRRLDLPSTTPPSPTPELVDSLDVTPMQRAEELVDALRQLAVLDEAEVTRLMTETLDATAYRRDAWTSSVHIRLLEHLRNQHPEGSFLGAYGFVLGLKRERDPIPSGGPAVHHDDPGTAGGFIAAQSLDQAATLAVLRNAHLTHAHDEDTAGILRLNLDSRRVRTGKSLIDAVRNGNLPADVIGVRFERMVHRRNQGLLADGVVTPADGLDQHIFGLRRLFPQRTEGTSADESDFRVVNGVELVEAWRQRNEADPPEGSRALARYLGALSGEERRELGPVLDALEEQVDAANDLLIYDAAFRTLRGDRSAATRTLDAHSGMAPPPELIGMDTPASGAGFTHRLVAPFTTEGIDGWPGRGNVRPTLAPELNAWVETLIGDPRRIKWGYQSDGAPIPKDLSEVDSLSAVDLVWTAEKWARANWSADPHDAGLTEVTQHLRVATGEHSRQPRFRLLLTAAQLGIDKGSSDVTLPEIGELCLRLGRALRSGRPIEPGDLLPTGAEAGADGDMDVVRNRVNDAANTVRQAADALTLQLEALRAVDTGDQITAETADRVVSRVVAANSAGATIDPINPHRLTSAPHFADYVASIESNIEKLRRAANAAEESINAPAGDEISSTASLREAVTEMAGRDYPLIVPFDLGETGGRALKTSREELAAVVDESSRRSWIQQAARVSPQMSELELALLLSEALGVDHAYSVEVAQLPWKDGEPWIGADLILDDDNPIQATTSIASIGPGSFQETGSIVGLFVDAINDRVPPAAHTGGLAFPFDQPSARAPQAIVIAVAPDVETVLATTEAGERGPSWRWEDLIGTVDFLIEETRLRAADPNYLEGLALSLPSTMFPYDPSSPVYTTNLVELARTEATQ